MRFTLKNTKINSLRGLFCAVLALPLLGMGLPGAIGFWSSATAMNEASLLTSTAIGHAPVIKPVEGQTCKDIYVEIPLTATDEDGDAVVFKLVDLPKLGTAEIKENILQYTPKEGKTGTDKFTYTAVDTTGNSAEPAQIKIKISKNAAKLTYADMAGNPAHYAALCLAEKEILTGEKIGAAYFFHPSDTVTRSEFIAMASAVARLPVVETAQTDFIDDAGLSDWAKPYISAAASTGLVSGYLTAAGTAEIRGEKPITAAEASVIVSNLLTESFDAPVEAAATGTDHIPVWASAAAARLAAAQILPKEENSSTEPITRQTACEMLYRAAVLME